MHWQFETRLLMVAMEKKQDSDYKSYYLELLMILIIFTVRINEELDCYKSN